MNIVCLYNTINSKFPVEIPEDPQIAEEYYNEEFESCSEDSETEEDVEVSQTVSKTNHQVCVTFGKTVHIWCFLRENETSSKILSYWYYWNFLLLGMCVYIGIIN